MKMSKSEDFNFFNLNLIVITFGVLIVIMVGIPMTVGIRHNKLTDQFRAELEGAGLTIIEGVIQSPSVIITVDSPEEFMEIVEEYYQDVIYYDPNIRYFCSKSFYVFNDDMTIAWKYTPPRMRLSG